METGLSYLYAVAAVMVLPHDLELSLDAPKSNCSIGFQPVFVHTIERCSIPARKLCINIELRVSTLGQTLDYTDSTNDFSILRAIVFACINMRWSKKDSLPACC